MLCTFNLNLNNRSERDALRHHGRLGDTSSLWLAVETKIVAQRPAAWPTCELLQRLRLPLQTGPGGAPGDTFALYR